MFPVLFKISASRKTEKLEICSPKKYLEYREDEEAVDRNGC